MIPTWYSSPGDDEWVSYRVLACARVLQHYLAYLFSLILWECRVKLYGWVSFFVSTPPAWAWLNYGTGLFASYHSKNLELQDIDWCLCSRKVVSLRVLKYGSTVWISRASWKFITTEWTIWSSSFNSSTLRGVYNEGYILVMTATIRALVFSTVF